MASNGLGELWETQRKKKRPFYLVCLLLPELSLDVTSCLLWQTLIFNLQELNVNSSLDVKRFQSGQCAPSLDMAFRLSFLCSNPQSLSGNCVCLSWESSGRGLPLIFSTSFSELKQPSLDHGFLCYICVWKHTLLIPALKRYRQADLCNSEGSLIYKEF